VFASVVLLAAGPGSDFVGTISTVGAPSFAQFAKGGNHERITNGVCAKGTKVVSAASLPALAKTQGRGTLSMDGPDEHHQEVRHPPGDQADRGIYGRVFVFVLAVGSEAIGVSWKGTASAVP
jgi:hypothetical protein